MTNTDIYSQAPSYFHHYFDLLETDNLLLELEKDRTKTIAFFESIPIELEHHAYQDGKWTISQVLRHTIDTERIFIYRALRFARFDKTELPGFDEDFYMDGMCQHCENLSDLLAEFNTVRKSSISLFKGMTTEMLNGVGTANGQKYSAAAIGFFMIGHNMHHCKVLIERYLN
jgi:uncharacterized damage-inducible protein DinB